MRALVTGGAGFIGSNVVRAGLARGWTMCVLDDLSTGYAGNLPGHPSLRLMQGDIRDPSVVDAAMSGVEVVFHLAASVGNVRSIERPADDSDVNVLGTLQVLEGMRRARVGRMVYSSSAAIFGEPRSLPVDEGHPAEPDSPYGVSKLAAEKHCLCYARLYGWKVACLRYFNVYGRQQRDDAYGNVIPIFAGRILRGEPLVIYGDGEQTRDFVHVEDVANANLRACERGACGPFNIGSGTATTINDLARLVMACGGREVGIERRPPRPGEVRHSVASLEASRRALAFVPAVGLSAGLTGYLEWMAAEGGVIPSASG